MTADWRSLWRRWRARPVMPALAVLVLVAGVASGATVLGVTWAVLLRPLPYPDPGTLVLVRSDFPGLKLTGMGLSGPEASELSSFARGLSAVGFGYASSALVDAGESPRRAEVARVSAGWARALGARPAAGRVFTDEEDAPAASCRVVVSGAFRDAIAGPSDDGLRQSLRIDGETCEVIGVWPARMDFAGRPVDVWAPLRYDVRSATSNRANHAFTVLARLAPGVTLEAARADLARAVDRWLVETGQFHSPSPKFHPLSMTPLEESIRGPVRATGLVLLLAIATMLVVTIANASALLVADADHRRGELAIRAALGADRRRLWRMHLMEAGTLGAAAGLMGGVLAIAATRVVGALAPASLANVDLALPGWQTAILAGVIAAVAAALCSLLQVSRLPWRSLSVVLQDDSRTGTAGRSRQRLRRGLVGMEVALAVALVAGAALMIESVGRLGRVDLGYRPEGVIRAQVNLPADRYDTRARIDAFYDALTATLRSRADVASAGVLTGLLPERRPNNSSIMVEGAVGDPHLGTPPVQFMQYLTPEAFPALGLDLREGRLFTPADSAGAQPVVLINERAARTYFAGRDAVGGRLRPMGAGLPWLTVVGIVADARQNGVVREPGTEIFVPLAQADGALGAASFTRDLQVIVRARTGDPAALGPVVRDAVRQLDRSAAVSDIETLQAVVARGIAAQRFLMFLLTGFAVVAVVLAGIGVYGILAHAVAQRAREIGVRRALGAPGGAIARLMLSQMGGLVAGGLIVGLVLATGGVRVLAPFSFETTLTSASRLSVIALGFLAVACAACVRPVLVALRVDPATVLKQP